MDPQIHIQRVPIRRRLKIEISRDGKVIVSVPNLTPNFVVDRFVAEHQVWIQRHLNKYKSKCNVQTATYIYLFGSKFDFVISNASKKPGLSILGSQIVFTPVAGGKKTPSKSLLSRFLQSTASAYILPRTRELADQIGVTYKKVRFTEQKTRWGSCSSTGTLSFNWRLVHFRPTVIDYVITHELAHIIHPNHSRSFWNTVRNYFPLYESAKKELGLYYW